MIPADPCDEPWARTAPARAVRALVLGGIFAPLVAGYASVMVRGSEHLASIGGPVVLLANHASHVDTPILLGALPPARRRWTLVGAAADYFYARRDLAVAVSLAFGAVPIRRRRAPEDDSSLAALEQLVGDGFSILLFAEGTRSRSGRIGELRPGAAALAQRRHVPLVPVRISGTAQLMPPGRGWMVRAGAGPRRRHAVIVDFGATLEPTTPDGIDGATAEARRFLAAPA